MTFDQALAETYADGIAVLHRGRIVFERYFGALEPHKQHIAMSVTKSFTGVLAGILVAEGKLDPTAPVTAYVSELKPSAFSDATVEPSTRALPNTAAERRRAKPLPASRRSPSAS